MPQSSRDPRIDPKPGDVFLVCGERITIETRGIMSPHAINQHGIRKGSEYYTYRIRSYPFMVCYQSVTGMRKRIRNAEVLHAAD